jgi:hypothetical protein
MFKPSILSILRTFSEYMTIICILNIVLQIAFFKRKTRSRVIILVLITTSLLVLFFVNPVQLIEKINLEQTAYISLIIAMLTFVFKQEFSKDTIINKLFVVSLSFALLSVVTPLFHYTPRPNVSTTTINKNITLFDLKTYYSGYMSSSMKGKVFGTLEIFYLGNIEPETQMKYMVNKTLDNKFNMGVGNGSIHFNERTIYFTNQIVCRFFTRGDTIIIESLSSSADPYLIFKNNPR